VLDFARKLDNGQIIDNVQIQNFQGSESEIVKNIKLINQGWSDRVNGKETSPRWKNVSVMTEEINQVLKGV
jgi:hypothetical protein